MGFRFYEDIYLSVIVGGEWITTVDGCGFLYWFIIEALSAYTDVRVVYW